MVKAMGSDPERAMSEMENWAMSMGAPQVPQVSSALLARIIGRGGQRSSGRGHNSRFSGHESGGTRSGGQGRDGYGSEDRATGRGYDSQFSGYESRGTRGGGQGRERGGGGGPRWMGRGRQSSRR
jgi:hypothetical protein